MSNDATSMLAVWYLMLKEPQQCKMVVHMYR